MGRLFNAGDRYSIKQYESQWSKAKLAGDTYGMQAAHDAANQVRLKYADAVKRVDFVNGGSSYVSKTNNVTIQEKDGLISETYVKGEIAVSLIANVGLMAKIQGGQLEIGFSYGTNGKFGASCSLTGGVSTSYGGKVVNSADIGSSVKILKFGIAEQKFSIDTTTGNWVNIIGAGIGVSTDFIPFNGEAGLSHESIFF